MAGLGRRCRPAWSIRLRIQWMLQPSFSVSDSCRCSDCRILRCIFIFISFYINFSFFCITHYFSWYDLDMRYFSNVFFEKKKKKKEQRFGAREISRQLVRELRNLSKLQSSSAIERWPLGLSFILDDRWACSTVDGMLRTTSPGLYLTKFRKIQRKLGYNLHLFLFLLLKGQSASRDAS